MEDRGTPGTDRPLEGMKRCEEYRDRERNDQAEESAE